jgi:hypothetical protein
MIVGVLHLSKSKNPGYIAGDHWETCDRCGQAFRSHQMKTQWDGLRVCEKDYDTRHQQDAVRETGSGCGTGPGGAGLDWNWGGGGYKPDLDPTTFIQEPNEDYFTTIPDGNFGNVGSEACAGYLGDKQAIYVAIDSSLSMDAYDDRFTPAKHGLYSVLSKLQNIVPSTGSSTTSNVQLLVLFFNGTSDFRELNNVTKDDIDTLTAWIDTQTTAFGTDFSEATSEVDRFFGTDHSDAVNKVFYFFTDGIPLPSGSEDTAKATLDTYPDIKRYGFVLGSEVTDFTPIQKIDNTPEDGIPQYAPVTAPEVTAGLEFAWEWGQSC